jgi:hypothetical protein
MSDVGITSRTQGLTALRLVIDGEWLAGTSQTTSTRLGKLYEFAAGGSEPRGFGQAHSNRLKGIGPLEKW